MPPSTRGAPGNRTDAPAAVDREHGGGLRSGRRYEHPTPEAPGASERYAGEKSAIGKGDQAPSASAGVDADDPLPSEGLEREDVVAPERAAGTGHARAVRPRDVGLRAASGGVAAASARERSRRASRTEQEEPARRRDDDSPVVARSGEVQRGGNMAEACPARAGRGAPGRGRGEQRAAYGERGKRGKDRGKGSRTHCAPR